MKASREKSKEGVQMVRRGDADACEVVIDVEGASTSSRRNSLLDVKVDSVEELREYFKSLSSYLHVASGNSLIECTNPEDMAHRMTAASKKQKGYLKHQSQCSQPQNDFTDEHVMLYARYLNLKSVSETKIAYWLPQHPPMAGPANPAPAKLPSDHRRNSLQKKCWLKLLVAGGLSLSALSLLTFFYLEDLKAFYQQGFPLTSKASNVSAVNASSAQGGVDVNVSGHMVTGSFGLAPLLLALLSYSFYRCCCVKSTENRPAAWGKLGAVGVLSFIGCASVYSFLSADSMLYQFLQQLVSHSVGGTVTPFAITLAAVAALGALGCCMGSAIKGAYRATCGAGQ